VVVVGICRANDLTDLLTTWWNIAEGKFVSARKHDDWVPLWVKKSGLVNLVVKGVAPRVISWYKSDSGAGSSALESTARTALRPNLAGNLPAPSTDHAAPLSLDPAAAAGSPQEKIAWVMKAWAHQAALRGYRLVLMPIPDASEVHGAASEGLLESIAAIRSVFLEAARNAAVAVIDPVEVLWEGAGRARTCTSSWRPSQQDGSSSARLVARGTYTQLGPAVAKPAGITPLAPAYPVICRSTS
jgi:hypothetical protein